MPETLDALDVDHMRRVLDERTAIENGLNDEARRCLAKALDSGRFVMFLGHLMPDGQLHWSLHQPEHPGNRMVDADMNAAVFHFANLIVKSRRPAETRLSNAVSDLGE